MNDNSLRVFAQFTEEQYQRLLLILEDRDDFPDSYSRWFKTNQNFMEYLARKRVAVYGVDVDADEFAAWCRFQGNKIDRHAVATYAYFRFNQLLAAQPPHPRTINYAPRRSVYPDLIEADSDNNDAM